MLSTGRSLYRAHHCLSMAGSLQSLKIIKPLSLSCEVGHACSSP